jgi:hypothetical protein
MNSDRFSSGRPGRRRPDHCTWGWVASDDPDADGKVFIAARLPPDTYVPPAARMQFQPRAWRARLGVGGPVVGLLVLLFRVEGCDPTFLVPINHHDPKIPNPLRDIVRTGIVRVALYADGPEPVLGLRCDIDLEAFQGALDAVASLPPWTEAQFAEALAALPPAERLWDLPLGGVDTTR